ncbi:MAG: 2-oxoacid:ferredoxin oxidoreductase subunit beta [Planctomycetales bacterium]|nr:2-oxoacid:ferredoxin oxidoreductase subunit beta [bacterium]UNM09531.1 MAG: 2-oxoacid:ferredoxin oxidoreductase subunit beta [Planctomycetales bacterium]
MSSTPLFRNATEPVWCDGCGDFHVLDGLCAALEGMGREPRNVALVSGIGCSSRLPGYMESHGFNSIHGRALPIASGLKLARPELTVIVTAGDGDIFSIGATHLVHTVRRNPAITLFVMDNGVYGLTKGQQSPTTPPGTQMRTAAQPVGDASVDPLSLMLSLGCGFVAQAYAADQPAMQQLMQQAIEYPGFSFVNILSPCPVFRGGMGIYKELRRSISRIDDSGHDPADLAAAHALLASAEAPLAGILFRRDLP